MDISGMHAASDIFSHVDENDFAEIIRLGMPREFRPKEVLFREGDPAREFFLVLDGHVKLSKMHSDGTETIVRYITPGQITAAISLLQDRKYPATACSVDTCRLVVWKKKDFERAMRSHPQLAINMMEIMAGRLFDVQDRYQELYREQAEFRISKTLLRLMEQSGRETPEGILIDFNLSRQSLASYAGTTQYTASRILSNWESKGWIVSGRERVTIVSSEAIMSVAESL
ncbi:Crp/Fnr family transcriptional regulator [Desulfoplanes sp. PS50]